MKTNHVSVSYWVKKTSTFSVEVKAWCDSDKWNWNVYAHIFSGHPLYDDNEALKSLPLHGGCTYDAIKKNSPLVMKYDWQKEYEYEAKTVGCDYAHLHGDYENHPSPFDYDFGLVPAPFHHCAEELADTLLEELGK